MHETWRVKQLVRACQTADSLPPAVHHDLSVASILLMSEADHRCFSNSGPLFYQIVRIGFSAGSFWLVSGGLPNLLGRRWSFGGLQKSSNIDRVNRFHDGSLLI